MNHRSRGKSFTRGALLLILGLALILPGMSLAAEETDPLQQEFQQGMKSRAQGDLYDAVNSFSSILASKPHLHRAKLELAVTYYRLYDYNKARELANQVLDDPATPANVRVSVLAFVARIDKDAEVMAGSRHTFRPSVGLGYLYDSNVNVGPSNDMFEIGGQTWQLNPDSSSTSDSAMIMAAGLSHTYRTDKTLRAGQKNARFMWQNYGNYYRRDYMDENAYDQDVLTLGTGPALVSVGSWRASASVQADYIRLGSDELAWFYSFVPSFTKQFGGGAWEISADGTVSRREYNHDNNDSGVEKNQGRDSTYYNGQLSLTHNIQALKLAVQAGARALKEDADFDEYSYDGYGFFGSLIWRPWQNGSFLGRVQERHLDYDGNIALFGMTRDERLSQYTFAFSQVIKSNHRWINDLAFSADYTRMENNSNIGIYEYDRNQITFMISKAF